MSSFWTIILLLILTVNTTSESKPRRKPSAVVVTGKVYCNTCFGPRHNLPKASQYSIAGASVVVECNDTCSKTRFRRQVKTDSHGKFKVHLPFPVSKHVSKIIRGCSVRIVSSNKPYCAVAASVTSSDLRLTSRKHGTHVFTAGFFTFRPLNQPEICDEKPSIDNDPSFIPPVQDRPSFGGSFLPPLPPLPQLPRLPPLPGIPFLPPLVPKKQPANDVPRLSENLPFPPNPFNLPITLPPIFALPNSPPLLNLPPIPGLIAAQPPPPPPLQLPPFPFRPTPGFPGVPPTSEKTAP